MDPVAAVPQTAKAVLVDDKKADEITMKWCLMKEKNPHSSWNEDFLLFINSNQHLLRIHGHLSTDGNGKEWLSMSKVQVIEDGNRL